MQLSKGGISLKYLLKGGRVWSEGVGEVRDLCLEDGKVVAGFTESAADRVIDVSGKEIFPGFIDLHCHLREPGFSSKETVKTGTLAAAKGGFTTVLSMPNTQPVLDNTWEMENYLRYLEDNTVVRVLPVAPLTKGRAGKELADLGSLAKLGIKFASDDGNDIANVALMRSALAYATDHGYTVLSHAEELALADGYLHAGYLTRDQGIPGISSSSESIAVARNLLLAGEVGAKIHLCHLSAKESVALLKLAKELGIQASAEVTPHHLYFADTEIQAFDTSYKVNPPIREEEDRLALREALKTGLIGAIATDHAPHTEKEKGQSLAAAPFGISSIEIAASVVNTIFADPALIYQRLSKGPSQIIGESHELKPGELADVVVFDPEVSFTVNKEKWVSKGKNSPYFTKQLKGRVVLTFRGGQIVYEQ